MGRTRARKTRKYGKRKRTYRGILPRITMAQPDQKLVRLRYHTLITLDAGVGLIAQHQFRMNSAFDPDYTGTGHQPMLYDQYAALYNRYCVLKTHMIARAIVSNNTSGVPGLMGILISTDSGGTAGFDLDELIENKYSSRTINNNTFLNGPPSKQSQISVTWNANRFFGTRDVQDGAAHRALVTANPSQDAYANVYVASLLANNPAIQVISVIIEYDVLFSDAVTTASS